MDFSRILVAACCAASLSLTAGLAVGADFPDPVEGDYQIKDFTFHTGETFDSLNMHYVTVGDPANPAVVVLHGTTGRGAGMLGEGFAGALFGPGEALDASKYFLILPDSIGTGGSSKPSDGLRAKFPEYNYDDMVDAYYRLVTEGLGIDHVRLIIGNSMGGMHVWTFGVRYPDFADGLVPMAASPVAMSGRNWMMRRMLVDAVKTDPAWNGGNYTEQPPNIRLATAWFGIATSNGEKRLSALGSDNAAANAFVDERLANQKVGDANEVMYQWNASRDFDPSADLEKITAHLLVINSEDDERNPVELGIMEAAMPRIANGEVYIIPATAETRGHSTTGGQAHLYAARLAEFMAKLEAQ